MQNVFVNGCFDPLHHGHISMLRYARNCGDRLIVGLNSDASLRRIKGPDRPRYGQNERVDALRSLRCVDDVIVFDEDTAEAVIRKIRPAVVVKGQQYTMATTVERQVISELGCELIFAPMVPGISSTLLMDQSLTSVTSRVHLITDLSLDRYFETVPTGNSAEYATTTYRKTGVTEFPGGGGNLAVSISRLSALSSLVSCVGNSVDDRKLEQVLRRDLVETKSLIRLNTAYCGVYGKVMSNVQGGGRHEMLRLDTVPERPPVSQMHLQKALTDLSTSLFRDDVLLISRYEFPERSGWHDDLLNQFCLTANQIGVRVICACRHGIAGMKCADIVVVNQSELNQLVPQTGCPDTALADCVTEIGERLCIETLVVTLGDRGAALWNRSNRNVEFFGTTPCPPGTDPTGAGDVFLAVFATLIGAGSDTHHATRCAVAEATRSLFAAARPAVVFSSAFVEGTVHAGIRAAS